MFWGGVYIGTILGFALGMWIKELLYRWYIKRGEIPPSLSDLIKKIQK